MNTFEFRSCASLTNMSDWIISRISSSSHAHTLEPHPTRTHACPSCICPTIMFRIIRSNPTPHARTTQLHCVCPIIIFWRLVSWLGILWRYCGLDRYPSLPKLTSHHFSCYFCFQMLKKRGITNQHQSEIRFELNLYRKKNSASWNLVTISRTHIIAQNIRRENTYLIIMNGGALIAIDNMFCRRVNINKNIVLLIVEDVSERVNNRSSFIFH